MNVHVSSVNYRKSPPASHHTRVTQSFSVVIALDAFVPGNSIRYRFRCSRFRSIFIGLQRRSLRARIRQGAASVRCVCVCVGVCSMLTSAHGRYRGLSNQLKLYCFTSVKMLSYYTFIHNTIGYPCDHGHFNTRAGRRVCIWAS